jgi:hypothetical protein
MQLLLSGDVSIMTISRRLSEEMRAGSRETGAKGTIMIFSEIEWLADKARLRPSHCRYGNSLIGPTITQSCGLCDMDERGSDRTNIPP